MVEHPREAAPDDAYREMQRDADQICGQIVAGDLPAIDVVIQIRKLRGFAEQHFPGKVGLFERLYESRFKRLWAQFRDEEQDPLPEW